MAAKKAAAKTDAPKKAATKKAAAKTTKKRRVAAKKTAKTRPQRRAKKKAQRVASEKTTHKKKPATQAAAKKVVAKKIAKKDTAKQARSTATERQQTRAVAKKATPPRKVQRKAAIHAAQREYQRAAQARASTRKMATRGGLTLAALDATGALERATGAIHDTVWLPAIPLDVYNAFLDIELHGAVTGSVAEVSAGAGEAFTARDGYIEGRNLELVPGQRIVQEWSTADWPVGFAPSRLTLTFIERDGGTELHLDHEQVPKDDVEKYAEAWQRHYFAPMQAHFAGADE